MIKRKRLFRCISMMIFMAFLVIGCSSGNPTVKPSPGDNPTLLLNDDQPVQRSVSDEEVTSMPAIEDMLPYPWYAHQALKVFTKFGIDAFYAYRKRVPKSFDEYINSGIPLIIPYDYVTGEPYHLVDAIDTEDTTGFTFWSDGAESCEFQFVINNNKTDQNEILPFRFTPRHFADYQITDGVPGVLADVDYYFDKVKREHCIKFFASYSYIYLRKHPGKAPTSINELLKDEEQPVEKGWNWTPEFGTNEYFEFGIDPDKLRYYTIQGSKRMKDSQPLPMYVQQMYSDVRNNYEYEQGVDEWSFNTADFIPTDIIELNKLISTDAFYDGYLELTAE